MINFIEAILKVIERAGKNWFFWLNITVCCLPFGVIFGWKYFSISTAFAIMFIITAIIKTVNYKKEKKEIYKAKIDQIYNLFKNLWKDERELLIELFLNKTSERKQNKFYIEGSYGLRSKEFYELIDYDNINSCEGENAIIHYNCYNKEGCNYYRFIIDEDFRLENYGYFQKLYNKNKEIVNK